MLALDCDEDEKRVAKFFRISLVEGSVADSWYNTLPDTTCKDWTLLLPQLKTKFEGDDFSKTQSLHAFFGLRCPDIDVGVPGEKGVEKQIIFANKLVQLSAKSGLDDSAARALALEHMGDELRAHINTKLPKSLQEIQAVILHLTPADIRKIRKDVRRENEIAVLRSQLASVQSQNRTPQPLAPSVRPNIPNAPNPAFNPPPAVDPSVSYATGPFPSTQDGWLKYHDTCRGFYAKFGQNAQSSPTRPFPLTPGTSPTVSSECWACGMTGHTKTQCKADTKVPPNEQRFRSLMAMQVMADRQQQRPWRSIGYDVVTPTYHQSPYDTPSTGSPGPYVPTIYDYENQGNGGESEL
jgi:hypothetical protein